jgi:hypothetical protein
MEWLMTDAELAVEVPVDEEAEAKIAEPLQAIGPVAFLARGGGD